MRYEYEKNFFFDEADDITHSRLDCVKLRCIHESFFKDNETSSLWLKFGYSPNSSNRKIFKGKTDWNAKLYGKTSNWKSTHNVSMNLEIRKINKWIGKKLFLWEN